MWFKKKGGVVVVFRPAVISSKGKWNNKGKKKQNTAGSADSPNGSNWLPYTTSIVKTIQRM